MRNTKTFCDACMDEIHINGYVFSYGRTGCVRRDADLCNNCRMAVEKALGITWDKLPAETQR